MPSGHIPRIILKIFRRQRRRSRLDEQKGFHQCLSTLRVQRAVNSRVPRAFRTSVSYNFLLFYWQLYDFIALCELCPVRFIVELMTTSHYQGNNCNRQEGRSQEPGAGSHRHQRQRRWFSGAQLRRALHYKQRKWLQTALSGLPIAHNANKQVSNPENKNRPSIYVPFKEFALYVRFENVICFLIK